MKHGLLFFFLGCLFVFRPGFAQNNNGQLDDLGEFTTKLTMPFTMPDGIKLMTDVYLPITKDSQVVTFNLGDISPILGNNPVTLEIIPKGTQMFLYDSIWLKSSSGQFDSVVANPTPYTLPVIFTRTPYNKRSEEAGQIVSLFGYAYAMQDMRGRYSSEGVYMPMLSDSWNKNPYHPDFGHVLDLEPLDHPKNGNRHEDGYNSIEILKSGLSRSLLADPTVNGWLTPDKVAHISDPLFNGSIGMFGASALGNTQYQAAAAHRIDPKGPGLKCLLAIVATNEHYKYTGYQNGVFRERIVTGWLKGQIFDVQDELIDLDTDIHDDLHTSFDYGLPNKFQAANNAIDHFVTVQYNNAPCGYYPNAPGRAEMDASRAWVDQNGEAVKRGKIVNGNKVVDVADTDPDGILGFGNSARPNLTFSRYTNKQVPAYHLTGWWDIFTDGQIETWALMRRYTAPEIRRRQKLVIGPWAHQTIGSTKTGDMVYPQNVSDILGFDLGNIDINNLNIADVFKSEVISWFRDNLNYNEYAMIKEPKVRIPASTKWAAVLNNPPLLTASLLFPSQDYLFTFNELLNFFNGTGGLNNVPIKVAYNAFGSIDTLNTTITIPATGTPIIENLAGGDEVPEIAHVDFDNDIANVRFYVPGPVNDGISENANIGNYWFESDTFPLVNHVRPTTLFLHADGSMNQSAPQWDEGYKMFVHNPDDPLFTHGGANMIVRTPDGDRDSQGQMDFSDPRYAHLVMNRPGAISFEREVTEDSLSVIGFPKMKLYAKSNPGGAVNGDPTDTDFFIRILDVYPDGRQMFVVEGCVNARARDYARALSEGLQEDHHTDTIPYSNIEAGKIYEYEFLLMPIAYTFGKGHKIKILITSSNYNRYQVNPNLPMNTNEFFRRQPGDGKKYVFNGVEMEPRVAVQRVAFSPEHPTQILLPVYDKTYSSVEDFANHGRPQFDALVYPNPASGQVSIYVSKNGSYHLNLFNLMGQKVFSTRFRDNITLETAQFDKGLYLVEIRNEDNPAEVTNKKVIFQ